MINQIEIIGFMAGFFTASMMIPQIIKSIKTKSVYDLSYIMLFIYSVNAALWLIYGILVNSLPMIIFDSLTVICGIWQIFLKFRYCKKIKLYF